MSERRYQRAVIAGRVTLTRPTGASYSGEARDISLCGLFVAGDPPYPTVGENLHIHLALGNEPQDDIDAEGVVVRHQVGLGPRGGGADGVGVEIVRIEVSCAARVEALIVSRMRALRFLRRLLDEPSATEELVGGYIQEFGLDLKGDREALAAEVDRQLRYFRIRA